MSRTSCKAVFHTDNKNLLNKSSSFYIPSQQSCSSFSTKEPLLKAEEKEHVTSTIKTSYKPCKYSQILDSKPVRETNSYKNCENPSEAVSAVNSVKKPLNELSDCIAYSSDIPLAEKFARLKKQFSENLSSEKEKCLTDSEVSTSFEVSSSLDSTESDLNNMSSIPDFKMMLDRFRNGKPRKPSERSKFEPAFSTKEPTENSNNISRDINDKKEIEDLRNRLQEVSINQLLQRSNKFSNMMSRPSLSTDQSANDCSLKQIPVEDNSENYPVRDAAAAGDGDILQRWRLKRKLENARTVASERKISHVYNSTNLSVSQKPSCLNQFSSCVLPYDVNHSNPPQLHSCCCKNREIKPPIVIETNSSTGVVVSTQTSDSLLENDDCKSCDDSTNQHKSKKKILQTEDADVTSIFESDGESDPFKDTLYASTENDHENVEENDVDLTRKAIQKVVKKQLFDTTDSSTDQSQLTKLSDEVFKDDLLQTSSNHAAVSSIFLQIDKSDNEFEDDEMMSNFRSHRNKILSRLRELDNMIGAFD